jgi:hypothetical protein
MARRHGFTLLTKAGAEVAQQNFAAARRTR